MKHSEVLSRYVNTGQQIPEEQYERLTTVLKKSYLRIRSVAGFKDWEYEFISDNQRINYIEIKGVKLEKDDAKDLLKYSINKDLIATKIIDVKGENLNYNDINNLLKYSDNKDLIATKIIDVKREKWNYTDVDFLLNYSINKDVIAKKIIDVKGEKLNVSDIVKLVTILKDNEYYIIPFILKIIDVKGEKLNDYDIHHLLEHSDNNDKIAIKIIESKGEKLNDYDINQLIKRSENKELIKKTLLQNGVDYKLINKVITSYNIDTPLIPDNYQSMLQEIRRIKEIMI